MVCQGGGKPGQAHARIPDGCTNQGGGKPTPVPYNEVACTTV